jgi:hypothetical protein
VATRTDGGHDDDGVLELLDSLARRIAGGHLTFTLMRWSTRASMSMASVRKLTPKGLSVCAHVIDGLTHLVERHGRSGDDAEPAGVGRGCCELGVGHPAHAGLDDRVLHPEELGGPRLQSRIDLGSHHFFPGVGGAAAPAGNSLLRTPLGSMTSRRRRSPAVEPTLGHVAVDDGLNVVASTI